MKHKVKCVSGMTLVLLAVAAMAFAHCQIPCGIYGDDMRFGMMREHVTTIEKSMREVVRLGKADPRNNNQIVRWVNNKELHANELAEIVTYYFMAQRVKPVDVADGASDAAYVRKITLLHRMLVQSMKAKQSTDTDVCDTLETLIDQFEAAYGGK